MLLLLRVRAKPEVSETHIGRLPMMQMTAVTQGHCSLELFPHLRSVRCVFKVPKRGYKAFNGIVLISIFQTPCRLMFQKDSLGL